MYVHPARNGAWRRDGEERPVHVLLLAVAQLAQLN